MNHIHCDKSLDAAASFCIGVAQRNLDCNLGTYILWGFFCTHLFYAEEYFACICLCAIHMQCPRRSEEGVRSPGTGVHHEDTKMFNVLY